MRKLIADLALARDAVDRAVAFGEAVPRLERLRNIVLWGLVTAVVILSASYIHLTSEMATIKNEQSLGNAERQRIMHQLDVAQGDRWVIMQALAGKSGASPRIQP